MVGNGASITVKSRLSIRPCFFSAAFIADIDAAADDVRGEHLALEILDLVDAAVLADEKLAAVVAGHAVLEFVGDDAQVVQAGVLDRKPNVE